MSKRAYTSSHEQAAMPPSGRSSTTMLGSHQYLNFNELNLNTREQMTNYTPNPHKAITPHIMVLLLAHTIIEQHLFFVRIYLII